MNLHLPAEHPLRRTLANEVHARPPVAVPVPGVVACLALLHDPEHPVADELASLRELAEAHGVTLEEPGGPHVVIDLPGLRVKWERHSEFSSYLFVRPLPEGQRIEALASLPSAFAALPDGWLARLPGQTMAAVDVTLVRHDGGPFPQEQVARLIDGPTLVGSFVSDRAGRVFTDFTLTPDGRTRWLLVDEQLTAGQRARITQRIVEIGIYRVMAMLAFPASRALASSLTRAESSLAAITSRIASRTGAAPAPAAGVARPAGPSTPPFVAGAGAPDPQQVLREDRTLLDALTLLAAEVEQGLAANAFRFSAAQAYWDLVQNRLNELREARVPGVPTVGEFLARRLAPAMNTVSATARRQQQLSARVTRSSELLRTRVDVALEEQNQRLLLAMDRRGRVSLRLQQTVEGLSIAALTYYATGLMGYLVKPLKTVYPELNPDWIVAGAVPVIAFLIWRAVHRIRQELIRKDD